MAFGSVCDTFPSILRFFRLSPGVSTPYKLEDQIVLAENLHPLFMTIKLLEPALSHLHQEEIVFVVIVKLLMMFMTEIAP